MDNKIDKFQNELKEIVDYLIEIRTKDIVVE